MGAGDLLPFGLCEMPDFLAAHARDALGETPEAKGRALREMRDALDGDPDLEWTGEESILLMMLRFKKFNVAAAVKHMKLGLRYVDSYRYLLERDRTEAIRRMAKANIVGFLPRRDPAGRAIIYCRSSAWDLDSLSAEDAILGGIVLVQSAIFSAVNQVAGYVVVLDLEGLKAQQVLAMTRWMVFGALTLQKACPCFMKTFHVVNIPPVYKVGWKVVKPLLSQKIKSRFLFHKGSDPSSLYAHIPREALPAEVGGLGPPFSNEHWAADVDAIYRKYREMLAANGFRSRHKKGAAKGRAQRAAAAGTSPR